MFGRGRVLSLLQMARELFFGVGAPLPDGAHLLDVQVLAGGVVAGGLRWSDAVGGKSGFGIFAHDTIVARSFRREKRPVFGACGARNVALVLCGPLAGVPSNGMQWLPKRGPIWRLLVEVCPGEPSVPAAAPVRRATKGSCY